MKSTRVALAVGLAFFSGLWWAEAQSSRLIEGVVLDDAGKPVEGVSIEAFSTSARIAQAQSDAAGRYRLDLKGLAGASTVRFSHPDKEELRLANIAGSSNNSISVILNPKAADGRSVDWLPLAVASAGEGSQVAVALIGSQDVADLRAFRTTSGDWTLLVQKRGPGVVLDQSPPETQPPKSPIVYRLDELAPKVLKSPAADPPKEESPVPKVPTSYRFDELRRR